MLTEETPHVIQQAEGTISTRDQSASKSPAKLFLVSRLEWSQIPTASSDKPGEGIVGPWESLFQCTTN